MADRTQELVAALLKVQLHHPNWRFGQLVCNVASWAGEDKPREVWDVSDEELLAAANSHLAQLEGGSDTSQRAAG
jgi:hypothetical protein